MTDQRGVLIRGGTIVDGTGAEPRPGDVRVRNGLIVDVGERLVPDGEEELDATGAYVTPGFIDVHTHLDPSLFWDPLADPLPQHGVTTALLGNCSLSLMPLQADQRQKLSSVFSYIEDIPEAAFAQGIPWTWETYEGYRDELRQGGLGVNAAPLIGHTPLRLFVMGDEAWERPADPDERGRLVAALGSSLRAGAFGLSTSFFDKDAQDRPVPSQLADHAELEALVGVLGRNDALLQFNPDWLSGAPGDDIERIAALTAPHGVLATWTGLTYSDRNPERAGLLDRAGQMQGEGVRIYPQVSPRATDIQINWERSMAFMSLPTGWHRLVQTPHGEKRALLEDAGWRATARDEWDAVHTSMFPHKRPDKVQLIAVTDPRNERWLGRTLADLVAERGIHPSDTLADWLLENDLRPGMVAVGVSNNDVDGVADMLCHPASLVGLSDAGAHVEMMCAAGDTTLLLTRHVRERGDLTLARAVWELTGRLADVFGFGGRGRVQAGAHADLVVFDLDALDWLPPVHVTDLPAGGGRLRRPPGGYRYTMASGVLTQVDGSLTGARPATVLDRGA